MSKGIVKARPVTNPPATGKLMVTEGTGVDPTQPLNPGTVLEFDQIGTSKDGDLVEYDFDAATGMAVITKTLVVGTVYTGNINKDIDVAAGECVLITAAKHVGKVIVNGGNLAIADTSTITGKVQSNAAGSYVLINGSTVEGKVASNNGSYLSVVNSQIVGKLISRTNKFVGVQGCTIVGSIEVVTPGICSCSGNTLNGSPIPGC